MNSKWQINRVGLLDFWYYDEEEFDFLDGRMLLRGANGSGKSVTMQSFIPVSYTHLPARRTVLCVYGAVRGVGGIDSWQSDVEDEYHISAEEDIRYSFTIC